LKLADPRAVLDNQKILIQEERTKRMMAASDTENSNPSDEYEYGYEDGSEVGGYVGQDIVG
jgi:hypothetical protein